MTGFSGTGSTIGRQCETGLTSQLWSENGKVILIIVEVEVPREAEF